MKVERQSLFSERHGYRQAPEFLKREEFPPSVRNKVWAVFSQFLANHVEIELLDEKYISGKGKEFVRSIWVELLEFDVDEMPTDFNQVYSLVKQWITEFPFNEAFDCIDLFLQSNEVPRGSTRINL